MFLITFKSPKNSQQGSCLKTGLIERIGDLLLHSMETRLVKSLTSTHMLKALLIDWQKETQNDWTKTADRGFDLRNSTSTHWTATFRNFPFRRFLSVFPGGEGAQQSFTGRGSAPRSQPLPLNIFNTYLSIDYPTHPCRILQLVNSLSFDTDPKPEKGTPFVRSLSVKVIIVNISPSQV